MFVHIALLRCIRYIYIDNFYRESLQGSNHLTNQTTFHAINIQYIYIPPHTAPTPTKILLYMTTLNRTKITRNINICNGLSEIQHQHLGLKFDLKFVML